MSNIPALKFRKFIPHSDKCKDAARAKCAAELAARNYSDGDLLLADITITGGINNEL